MRPKYSVIIPVYNEEDAVIPLFSELKKVMDQLNNAYEIIFIDDGSEDNTLGKLKSLRPVKIVQFRKNFGQTAALDAGIKEARGEIIITLDGDGQNPPSEIPKLLNKLNEGYDLVSGWRYQRKDPLMKKFLSRGANFLRKYLVKDHIHDSGCTLKVYRQECFEGMTLYGEIHRFIPAMLAWRGFKVGEVKVEHRPRRGGKAKYGPKRIIKGFIDMWNVWFWRKYSGRPLHLFGGLGFLFITIGSILGIYLAVGRILGLFTLQNRIWPLVAIFCFLAGLQLFVTGILADIAVKTYYSGDRKVYSIRKIFKQ